MIAKYPGTCRLCSKPIKAGEKIKWVAGKGAFHDACPGRCEMGENCIPYHNRQYDACIGCKEYAKQLTADDFNEDQQSARRAEWAAAEAEGGNIDY